MAIDGRKKGCPNEECERHQKKIKMKATDEFCPKCGTRLVYVCSKCFTEIENIDPKHKICKLCEAKEQQLKNNVAKKAKAAGGVAAAGVGAVAVKAYKKVTKDAENYAVNKAVKVVENAVKHVFIK